MLSAVVYIKAIRSIIKDENVLVIALPLHRAISALRLISTKDDEKIEQHAR